MFKSENLSKIGITRLGRLTELDIIGVPVWFACRPNSRCLSVTQGKGLTDEQARISAFMEAAEYAYAENAEPITKCIANIDELAQRNERIIDLEKLSNRRVRHFDFNAQRHWVQGKSLISGDEILAPYEAIGMDMRVPSQWDNASFRMSSVGLAAGFTLEHAIRHAMFEVIENDATSLIDAIGFMPNMLNVIDHKECTSVALSAVLTCIEHAQLKATFHTLKSGTGFPVIGAIIEDQKTTKESLRHGGYAARATIEEAALAALLEAIQSRLTDIAGAREDIAEQETRSIVKPMLGQKIGSLPEINYVPPPQPNLDEMIAACTKAGASDVLVFRLGGAELGIAVVKLLIPGLDQSFEDGQNHFGLNTLRAFTALGGHRT
jgi:ribosomal protein S12 methylthiotransferase accessory factor